MKTKNRPPQTTHRPETARPRTRSIVREAGRLLVKGLARVRAPKNPPVPYPSPSQTQTELRPAYEQTDPIRYDQPRMEVLRAQQVNVGERLPLLTSQQVSEQLGFDSTAALQAVIDLPTSGAWFHDAYKPQRLYVFYEAPSTGRHGSKTPQYTVMTATQIRQLQQHARTGWPKLEDIHRNSLHLSMAPATDGSSRHEAVIGRNHWLPDLGTNAKPESLNPAVRANYEVISREQARLYLDNQGDLIIRDLGSKNATTVTSGQTIAELQSPTPAADPWAAYQPAVDPWEGRGLGESLYYNTPEYVATPWAMQAADPRFNQGHAMSGTHHKQ